MRWQRASILMLAALSLSWADETPQTLLESTTDQSDLTLVDPELSNTPLPKLVLPPEAPDGLRLPELIVKADEWKGVQCGVLEQRDAVFRHADKWASFWEKALAPYSSQLAKVPVVDFGKDMVVGVFMGDRDRPSYEIEIRSIREENRPDAGKALVVRYREIAKMQGVFVPPFAVQPFHMKKVPKFEGQVIFLKVRR
jgi:hypothetical protein